MTFCRFVVPCISAAKIKASPSDTVQKQDKIRSQFQKRNATQNVTGYIFAKKMARNQRNSVNFYPLLVEAMGVESIKYRKLVIFIH